MIIVTVVIGSAWAWSERERERGRRCEGDPGSRSSSPHYSIVALSSQDVRLSWNLLYRASLPDSAL